MTEPIVRPARAEDAAALADLAALTFPLACPPGASPESVAQFIAENLTAERFAEYLSDPGRALLIAERDGAAVGYVMLVHGEPYDADVRAAIAHTPTTELSKIYVHPDAHGAGVAALLLSEAVAVAREIGAAGMWLGTNQLNARAQGFYAKSGFEKVGEKRFWVGDHWEDDFVFELALGRGPSAWQASAMSSLPTTFADDVIDQPARAQLEVFIDEHRAELAQCLDGLTEEQARRSLVPSRTTLLGLVKHVTFVEKVWFDEAVTRRSRAEIGIPATPDESFVLDEHDTIASVRAAHLEACAASRRATAELGMDDLLLGNRRGPLPLRWVYFHVLRELAQHCGHADILREQILSAPE